MFNIHVTNVYTLRCKEDDRRCLRYSGTYCYFTVHFYIILPFCDCIWYFEAAASVCRFFFKPFVYMYFRWRLSYQEGTVEMPLIVLTSTTLLYLSQSRMWISNVICRGLFVYSEFS